jgi:hypothetical protein
MLRILCQCRRRQIWLPWRVLCCGYLVLICNPASAQQASSFNAIGYLQTVDPPHHKVVLQSGATSYTVDTSHSAIHLPVDTAVTCDTGDLVTGMRVNVVGTVVAGPLIRASRLQVLPYIPPTTPAKPQIEFTKVEGTVDSVDTVHSTVTLVVNGTDRTIQISSPTTIAASDGSNLSLDSLSAGDTLQIRGASNADGTLDATSIVRTGVAAPLDQAQPVVPATPVVPSDQVLSGTITAGPSIFARDIKVQTQTGETKVTVPRGVPIEIDGKPSSVHDLRKNMTVQIFGAMLPNDTFQADHVISISQAIPTD